MTASPLPSAMAALEERVVAWARTRDDIRAAIVVGSQARTDHGADEWADLDVMLFVRDTKAYLSRSNWISEIRPVWVASRGRTVGGDPEWLIVLEGGVDLDLVFLSTARARWGVRSLALLKRYPQLLRLLPGDLAAQAREAIPLASQTFVRGVRVLLDRDGLIPPMQRLFNQQRSAAPVTPREFLEAVHLFWLVAERTAKKLRRGELWVAKYRGDFLLKDSLLQMMKWQHCARAGRRVDTWHDGRFLEEWADPEVLARLRDASAHYDEDDLWRALLATMDLFRDLARDTAKRLGIDYPAQADACVTGLVARLDAGRARDSGG